MSATYATIGELSAHLGSGVYAQLTDRVNLTTANDVVGQALLDEGQGVVDGHLARRYTTPVDATGDAALADRLRGLTLDIAAYRAWVGCAVKLAIPAKIIAAYGAAIKYLEAVAAGTQSLPAASALPSATADGDAATAVGYERVFTEDAMKGL